MSSSKTTYIPTLDGWRAIAILLVVFHHDQTHRLGPLSTSWLYTHGHTGVDIFFAISGFLICTLLMEEELQTGRISLREFYVRRAFRILPAALTYLVVVGALRVIHLISAVGLSDWVGSALFFRNFLPDAPPTWYTGHFWSLSVEEHFYLFLPAFLVLCVRRRGTILFVMGVLTVGFGAIFGRLGFSVIFSDFRLGALLVAAGTAIFLRQEDFRKHAARVLVPGFAIGAMLIVFTMAHSYFGSLWIPFMSLAAVTSTVLNPSSFIALILESKVLRFVGKRSYSLYLWQQLFMSAHYRPIADFALQKWPFSILMSFACACLSYSVIEQPFILLGRRVIIAAQKRSCEHDSNMLSYHAQP